MKLHNPNTRRMTTQWKISPKTVLTAWGIVLVLLSSAQGAILTAGAQAPATISRDIATAPAAGQDRGAPPEGLSTDEWASMQELIAAAQYQFTWQVSDGAWAYRAPNRAHDLALSLAVDGFKAVRYSPEGEPLWEFGLSLVAYGEQTFPAAIAEEGLKGSRERVEYHWSQEVVEWYINSADGIEHGLTLAAPPAGANDRVELTFALRGLLIPELDRDGNALRLKDASGQTALLYDELAVYDANGHSLPTHFSLSPGGEGQGEGGRLHITIDAAGAAYPITVDPLLHEQTAKLTASDPQNGDRFGNSVAISGDVLVIGAIYEDGEGSDRGAAYVFERNKNGTDVWGQVTKLTASAPADGDRFGVSVAISGDTLVVGADREDDPVANCGAAYIFGRNHGGPDHWGQVKRLTAHNAEEGDYFGYSVAISGDTLVVGAPHEDGGIGGLDRGMAYIFERNHNPDNPSLPLADNWGEVTYLTAGSIENSIFFGYSVAISVDTVIAGAYGVDGAGTDHGAAYIFTRNKLYTDDWGRIKTLSAPNAQDDDRFGFSVAISGEFALVGAYGEDGRGGDNIGAAYLFERNQGGTADNWGQVKRLTASDAGGDSHFGISVAISGDTLVVGAEGEDIGHGAARIFERNQGGADNWGQLAMLTASDAEENDHFGASVAISGDTVVVGAPYEDGAGTDRGAAYLFVAGDGQWPEVASLYASDAADDDRFGLSVAISGDIAVVGADWEDGEGTDRGAAYIVERNEGGADSWGQATKLSASDAADEDYFGESVAISGDTVIVGAWGKDATIISVDQGAAYIFARNQGGADSWGQVKKLSADSSIFNDVWFGYSVAISGDTVVVGAWGEEDVNDIARGAAYIFERNQGGTDIWGRVAKLTPDYSIDEDHFGYSVAISGDTVVVGAHGEDNESPFSEDRGAAYIFTRNQGGANNWGKVKKLIASDAADLDNFGISVAISGDTLIVGADREDGVGGNNRGAAYIFERNYNPSDPGNPLPNNWGQVKKLTATDTDNQDHFGISVAISNDTVVVGAYLEDGGMFTTNRGAAYIFERNQGWADNWGQVKKLSPFGLKSYIYFGWAVGISDDKIIVGAYGEDGAGSNQGAAYIYYRWELSPEITVSPGSLAFGAQGVDDGPTPSKQVTITNDGDGDLNISDLSLSGADAAEFAITSDSGETTLAPGATRTIQISFDPSSEGAKSANLSITSDDSDEPTVNVVLSGSGVSGDTGWYVYLPLVSNE